MNKKLKKACDESGMTREEIADKAGIGRHYIWHLIQENHSPSQRVIKGLMKALNKTYEELFGDEK